MKQTIKLITITFLIALIFSSCRKEFMISETEPNQSGLVANSTLTSLMNMVSLNDGSDDNIIDSASSIKIKLPVTVIINGIKVFVVSEKDFNTIERIFDEYDNDKDELQIIFPITIVLSDFTEITINNQSEFDSIKNKYSGENIVDDDIECIDFVYPVTATVFDVITEQIDFITITNDNEMHIFLNNIDGDDIANINFPVSMVLPDSTRINIASLKELENAINNAKGSCDEDDDNDFDDDGNVDGEDVADSTLAQFTEMLASCSDWIVDKLELNDSDLENNYIGYTFNFRKDSTLLVHENSNNFSGTWSSYKNGENVIVVIKLPALPDFNASWNLDNIEQGEVIKGIGLSRGENNLRFVSSCN